MSISQKPKSVSKKRQAQRAAEYQKHLVPISWSDFPIEYMQELQERLDKIQSDKQKSSWTSLEWNTYSSGARFYYSDVSPQDRDRATKVPLFYYGILFSRRETELYGEQCYGKQLQAVGEQYDGHPLPANTPSIVNWVNRRLREEGYPESLEFQAGEPYDEDERVIIYLISTQSLDESPWKDVEQLKLAFALLREELQLSEDRQPMWYFDREFFGPQVTGYKKFDIDRMVGSELLKRLPEHVQAAIRAGTGWESSKPSD